MSMLFEPVDNATVSIAAVSTSSQSVIVQNYSGENQIAVVNGASGTIFVRFGGSAVVAIAPAGSTVGDIPVLAGTVRGFSVPSAASTIYAAVICPSGTGAVYFTPGSGI